MIDRLYMPGYLTQILKKHGFTFSKALGQNFLIDGNIVESIVDQSQVGDQDLVIEIGPGMGTLTEEIATKAKKVIALELDRRLIPILEENLQRFDNIEIIQGDALEMDFQALIEANPGYEKVRLIANLPYNIGTAIVISILEKRVPFDSLSIMLQKEVAERMIAQVGSKNFGSLSLLTQFYSHPRILLRVPKTVFIPKPKVDSMVIRLDVKDQDKQDHEDLMFRLIRASFNQRRKTILNSMTSGGDLDKEELKQVLENLEIDSKNRAQDLSLETYEAIAKRIIGGPGQDEAFKEEKIEI